MASIGELKIEIPTTHRVRDREAVIDVLQTIKDRLDGVPMADGRKATVAFDMLAIEESLGHRKGVREWRPGPVVVRFILTPVEDKDLDQGG